MTTFLQPAITQDGHLDGRCQGGLHNSKGGREELREDGVLLEEVAAEEVLRSSGVHQQLVHASEEHLCVMM